MFKIVTVFILAFTLILGTSQANAQTCLLDSSEHADLLGSIKKLKEKLSLVPEECKTESARQAFQSIDGLKDSSGKLHEFVTSQAMPMDPTQFSAAAQTAIDSVNSITKSLKSAGTCLKSNEKKDTLVSILSSMSDVTMNLAPVLMAATIFMPMVGQMGIVGKFATSAVSSLPIGKSLSLALLVGVSAKIIEGVAELANDKENPLDMKNPEHRNLVAKSICDYQRIKMKVRELSKFNGGQTDYGRKYEDTLKNIANLEQRYRKKYPEIADLIVKYHGLKSAIKTDFDRILEARKNLSEFNEIYKRNEDPAVRCSVASNFVNMNSVFKNLQTPNEEYLVVLLKVIDENKVEIVESLTAAKGKGPGTPGYDHRAFQYGLCLKAVDRWKNNAAIYLGELSGAIQTRTQKLYESLLVDKIFNEWRNASSLLEADSILYEKIKSYISKTGDDSDLIPESEFVIEFRDLDKQLFAPPPSWFGKSLAGKWLEHRLKEYDDMVNAFDESFLALNTATNDAYIKKEMDAYSKDPKRVANPLARMEIQAKMDKTRWQLRLENLTKGLFFRGRQIRDTSNTCTQLTDLLTESDSASKVFNSAGLFCYYLISAKLINPNMDKFIISRCVGQYGIYDDNSNSKWRKMQKAQTSEYGLTTRTSIVHKKAIEFGCFPAVEGQGFK